MDHFFSRGMDLDKVYIVDWKIRVQEDEVCHQQQDYKIIWCFSLNLEIYFHEWSFLCIRIMWNLLDYQ